MLIEAIRIEGFRSIADTGTMQLGPVTLLLGRNNSGKSCLIRALMKAQGPIVTHEEDWRLGAPPEISLTIVYSSGRVVGDRLAHHELDEFTTPTHEIIFRGTGAQSLITHGAGGRTNLGNQTFTDRMPHNLFVPILSRRKASNYSAVVDRGRATVVQVLDTDLTARIDALMSGDHAEGRKYRQMVYEVLGLEIGTFVTNSGKQPGVVLDSFTGIALDRLGEGVSSVVALLSSLAYESDQYVYLLEEPENDLHPQALKSLLDVILAAVSRGNQFIVSTHSDLVLRTLGSVVGAKVFSATLDNSAGVPTTEFAKVDDVFGRRGVLADLGYPSSDPLGWLVLEESTAERVINSILIPTFTPELAAVRTVAAGGVSKAEATFDDLYRTILFLHLDGDRGPKPAWMIVDGDSVGQTVIDSMRGKFKTWPKGRFRVWSRPHFEAYYPARFSSEVDTALAIPDKTQRQRAKGALVERVVAWATANPDEARVDFVESAAEVIQVLSEISTELAELGRPGAS